MIAGLAVSPILPQPKPVLPQGNPDYLRHIAFQIEDALENGRGSNKPITLVRPLADIMRLALFDFADHIEREDGPAL